MNNCSPNSHMPSTLLLANTKRDHFAILCISASNRKRRPYYIFKMIKAFSLVFSRITTRLKGFSNVRTIVNYIKCMARLDYKMSVRLYAQNAIMRAHIRIIVRSTAAISHIKSAIHSSKSSRIAKPHASSNIRNRMTMATTKTIQKLATLIASFAFLFASVCTCEILGACVSQPILKSDNRS